MLNKVPILCLSNGLAFYEIPDCLKILTELEERKGIIETLQKGESASYAFLTSSTIAAYLSLIKSRPGVQTMSCTSTRPIWTIPSASISYRMCRPSAATALPPVLSAPWKQFGRIPGVPGWNTSSMPLSRPSLIARTPRFLGCNECLSIGDTAFGWSSK